MFDLAISRETAVIKDDGQSLLLGVNTGETDAKDTRHNFGRNLLSHAQYLVGSCGYYRVTYRPVTILAPVNQLSVGTSVAGGNEGL